MSKAFVMLEADRLEVGAVVVTGTTVQQETRLYQGGQCVCVLLVTYPPGTPEWEKVMAAMTEVCTADPSAPVICSHSVASDAVGRAL